jgi:hypothetical protein
MSELGKTEPDSLGRSQISENIAIMFFFASADLRDLSYSLFMTKTVPDQRGAKARISKIP